MNVSPQAYAGIAEALEKKKEEILATRDDQKQSLQLRLGQLKERQSALIDAYLDRVLDRADFAARNTSLHDEELAVEHALAQADHPERRFEEKAAKFLELLKSMQSLPEVAHRPELREVLQLAVSNFSVRGKSVAVQWAKPLQPLLGQGGNLVCEAEREGYRTLAQDRTALFQQIAHELFVDARPKLARHPNPADTLPPLGSPHGGAYGQHNDHQSERNRQQTTEHADCLDCTS